MTALRRWTRPAYDVRGELVGTQQLVEQADGTLVGIDADGTCEPIPAAMVRGLPADVFARTIDYVPAAVAR